MNMKFTFCITESKIKGMIENPEDDFIITSYQDVTAFWYK